MRRYMVCPQNEEMLHTIPPRVVAEIRADTLAGLDNAAVYARIMKVLDDNAINNEGGLHSWRCFDKERYPEPCSCAGEVVVEILQAISGPEGTHVTTEGSGGMTSDAQMDEVEGSDAHQP